MDYIRKACFKNVGAISITPLPRYCGCPKCGGDVRLHAVLRPIANQCCLELRNTRLRDARFNHAFSILSTLFDLPPDLDAFIDEKHDEYNLKSWPMTEEYAEIFVARLIHEWECSMDGMGTNSKISRWSFHS